MGVSGCGKSTIGQMLSEKLMGDFVDADDLHPQTNIDKMSAGQPLTDDDRGPWLDIVGQAFRTIDAPRVMACSALKRSYRERITDEAGSDVCFVYLHGTPAVLTSRVSGRADHFMPPALLQSQLDTLEEPTKDELSITISIDQSPDEIVADIMAKLVS
jgi:gluconokinase